MKTFDKVKFKWQFRDYQQRVLDNSKKYLKDKRINIVAAPGSGKTILGLELITRLRKPCIILSPTITIRDQWMDRFKEAFIDEKEDISEYFSNDLNDIKLLNTITYQALHSAIDNVSSFDDEERVDYSNLDLFKVLNKYEISTICLDEAHHLKNEWQRALEKFIKTLGSNVTIISLTATPPYDSSNEEWKRYVNVCGKIDEEIFVPELVKQNTLCPHQDYVYFNFPNSEEIADFKDYRNRAYLAIEELIKSNEFILFYNLINNNDNFDYEKTLKDIKGFSSILSLFNYASFKLDEKIKSGIFGKEKIKSFNLLEGENAIEYMLDSEVLSQQDKEMILNIFKRHSLVERGKVRLDLNEKLRKKLVSSTGKLISISNIVKSEFNFLKNNLRMLVLTDYIKKESIVDVGTNNNFNNISIVSIFETIRRNNSDIKIGALSGSLIILPIDIKDVLVDNLNLTNRDFSFKPIDNTEYAEFTFKGSNKEKVSLIGKLFENGYISVLVGTKSLLGEGWDSPCINSLILASFVGSFMLSNQMRGRAIRVYKNNPDKVSNIWHLVTIEPSYIFDNDNYIDNENSIVSQDFEILKRRFQAFVGPNYEKRKIENGIDRLTCIKGPYNKSGIELINKSMLELALKRENMKNIWLEALDGDAKLCLVSIIDKEKRIPLRIPIFSFLKNILYILVYIILFIYTGNLNGFSQGLFLFLSMIVVLVTLPLNIKEILIFINHFKSSNSIKCLSKIVLNSLQEINLINNKAKLKLEKNNDFSYEVSLSDSNFEEQSIFNNSITEFLSINEENRYIAIKKNIFSMKDFSISFSIPSIIGNNKKNVEVMNRNLSKNIGKFDVVYVKNKDTTTIILEHRKNSYVTKGNKVESKQKVI